MKEKFTTERWEKTLTAVFVKSISDQEYRQLCLTNPREAVEVVAPDLELPHDFHFRFAAEEKNVVYSYLLPPPLDDCTSTTEYAEMLIEQNANGLTHPPTNTSGTSDPNGGGETKGGSSQPTGSPTE